MSKHSIDKNRIYCALIVFSGILILKSCNGTLSKEEKKGVVVEPPKVEDQQFDGVVIPSDMDDVEKNIEEYINQNGGLEPTTRRAK